ncbi:MAG: hypothetical protein FJY85_02515, partial [Deltaproteobacteria bacterium]|nr:hypothetical protein [Deltaproteobacteria bacterium]
MDPHEITAISVGVVTAVVFILTFLMGDIVGVIIEARSKRQWRRIGQEMGFEFYGTKTRNSSLSKFFLSKVIGPETDESAFCYCDLLKTLTGRVGRLKVLIADFTVWNLHTRGPLVYRVVLCLLTGEGLLLLNPLAIARRNSVLIPGFRLTQTLRE